MNFDSPRVRQRAGKFRPRFFLPGDKPVARPGSRPGARIFKFLTWKPTRNPKFQARRPDPEERGPYRAALYRALITLLKCSFFQLCNGRKILVVDVNFEHEFLFYVITLSCNFYLPEITQEHIILSYHGVKLDTRLK